MTLPVHPDIVVTPVWDYGRAAYTLEVSWSALYPEFDEDTSFRVLAFSGEEQLGDVSTVNNTLAVYGMPPETELRIELVVFVGWEMTHLVTSVTSDIGLPGKLVNYTLDRGEDWLEVSWDDIPYADAYRSRIYLDGQLLESKDSTASIVQFHGLPHSRLFRIEIQPYNALNDGDITTIETHTIYLVPPAPYDVRQFEERVIAVILQWEIAEVEIITEVEIEAWDGETRFLHDTMDPGQRERSIPCPSTGTTYLFKLRAGNPAGWSEWVEFEGHTEVFPLVDSRVAALAAAYQEDELRPDTWNHSLRGDMGLVETTRIGATFEVAPDGYIYKDAGRIAIAQNVSDTIEFVHTHEINVWSRFVQHTIWVEEIALFDQQPSFTAELEYDPIPTFTLYGWADSRAMFDQQPAFDIWLRKAQFQMGFSDTGRFDQTPSLTITLEIQNAN